MSIYDEVAELIWDNGNLSMHGLSGLQHTSDERPTLNRAQDTLESLVQQGTCQHQIQKPKYILKENAPTSVSSIDASSRKDNDTTLMTWISRESGRSLDNTQEDSDRHCGSDIRDNQDERGIKGEIGRTNSKRRNRIAAIHNQSERKRRDRINQKLKELQRLVPNANKTDKASMLDEVINYLKQLQSQIQIMNMTRMSHMMMPLAMQQQQQQLQMSMLARLGMVNINNMVPHNPMFVSPSFMMPSLIQPHSQAATKVSPSASSRTNASIPLPDPYSTNLAQSVNMDILNFSALYKNQMRQKNGAIDSTTQ